MAKVIKAVVDSRQLMSWLKTVNKDINNLTPIMRLSAVLMRANVIKHFDIDKKNESGSPWKNAKNPPNKGSTLLRGGDLRRSINDRFTSKNAEAYTNLEYAAIHNFGGIIPARFVKPKKASVLSWVSGGQRFFSKGHFIRAATMPKREFMWIDQKTEDKIAVLFTKIFD